MFLTVEISLYPLETEYEEHIIKFLTRLKKFDNIEVHTHAMSTFVKGKSSEVFTALDTSLKVLHEDGVMASLVMKAINKDLPVASGFLKF